MKKHTSLEHTIRKVVSEQNYRNQPIDEAVGAIGTDKAHDVPRAFFKSVHVQPRKGEGQIPATGTTRSGRNYELEKAGVHKEEAEVVGESAAAAALLSPVISKTVNIIDRFVRSGAAPKRAPAPAPAPPPARPPAPKPEKPPGEVVPFKKPGEKPEQPPATPPAPAPGPKPGTTPKPTPDKKPPRELPKEPPAEPEKAPEPPPSEEPKKPEPKTTPPAPAPATPPTPKPAAPPAPDQTPVPAQQPGQQPAPAQAPAPAQQSPSGMPAPAVVPTPRKNQPSPSPNAKPDPAGKKPEDKPRRDYPLPAGGGTSISEPSAAAARVPILSRIAIPHKRKQAHFEETRYDIKNVARPDENRNDSIVGRPKDNKSKYTKQAEIIRKVVEEKRIILNKKKEENQGKNPLVDTEPTLKYNPLDQGTKDVR